MIFKEETLLFIIQQAITYSLFVVLLLILGIFYLQIKQHQAQKKDKRFSDFLTNYFEHDNFRSLRLDNVRFFKFISFWSTSFNNKQHEEEKLLRMAKKLNLHNICIKKIKSKLIFTTSNVKKISLMIHTIGNILHDDSDTIEIQKELEILASYSQHMIVFESCIALLKINQKNYYSFVIKKILFREDWSNKELKYLMSFYKTKESLEIIDDLIKSFDKENEKRIMQIASTTDSFSYFVKYILEHQENFSDESISLAIKNINNIEDFKLIEHLKESSNWIFQLNIIQAISNLHYFTNDNLHYLYKNLSNSNWWIRNRSAQALVQYHDLDYNAINQLILEMNDNFAKDALIGALNQSKIKHNVI